MSPTLFRRRALEVYTAALVAGIGVLLTACRQAQPTPPPPQVTVAPAVTRDVADEDEFTGHFEAVNAVEVRPRVGGFVQRVAFAEGALVKQGELLVLIGARPSHRGVTRAEAEHG